MSEKARCRGLTKAGNKCRKVAQEDSSFCATHQPEAAFEIVPEETAVVSPSEPGVWRCPHCQTQYPEGARGTALELRKRNHLRRSHSITVE